MCGILTAGTYREAGGRLRRVKPDDKEHLLVFLHGGKYLSTEITALLLVALFLAVLPLRRLRFVRFLCLLLAFLLTIGTLLIFFRRLEYLK